MDKSKLKIKNFVAIDFETATNDRHACQIGIASVIDRKLADSTSALIQPPGNKYDDGCVMVHGITPAKTEESPTFDQYYKHLKEIMESTLVVMHNAPFDLSVMDKECEHYGLPKIDTSNVICTYQLYGHSLADLCAGFGIPCDGHHDAEFDAKCTAQFFLNWLADIEPDESKYGTIKEDFFNKSHGRLCGDVLKKDLSNADPENMFYDKKVVITGVFPMDRKELADRLKRNGADIDTGVTVRTDYMLVGDDPGWRKMEKAQKLRESGAKLQILHWDDFAESI